MSRQTYSLWLVLAVWSAGAVWWHTCKIKQLCDMPVVTETAAALTNQSLEITDGADLSLVSPGNFAFARSGADAYYSAVQPEVDSLASYLRTNTGKQLTITGYYSPMEVNETQWPNLGIARAEGIKRYYVSLGLPENMFVVQSEQKLDLSFSADSLHGGIAFGFADKTSETRLAEAQKYEGIFVALDLYYNSGSTEYIHTPDNQAFLDEAKRYLAVNKDKVLLLTGHTDNIGTPEANALLSKERAEHVKTQLIALGLPEEQLATDSKGQADPKDTNDTDEGRAANRRVSIIVK